jgi:hypothetical protein
MHPGIAYTMTAHTISPHGDGMRVSRPQPFLEAAAQAMNIDRLRVIDSGLDPVWGQSGAADDGSNVLAVGRRLVVSHERSFEANARLEGAGVRVIRVPSSELGSLRGGPRCMTCSVERDGVRQGADITTPDVRAERGVAAAAISVPGSRKADEPSLVPAALAVAAMVTSASWPSEAAERMVPDYLTGQRLPEEQTAAQPA